MKVETVNVVEYADSEILGVRSFSNDEEGIKEANKLFQECVRENGDKVTAEEMAEYVEEGYFEQGDYQIFMVFSN